jgi:hypothetical protein
MKIFLQLSASLLFLNTAFAQAPAVPNYTFFNSGDSVFLEPGALLHIGKDIDAGPSGTDGDLVVKNETGNSDGFYNDGIISVSGNIYYGDTVNGNDYKNPVLKPAGFLSGYAERMVSLTGDGNIQYIKGFLDQPEQSFYNFAIDKAGADPAKIVMETDIRINGSLLWNPKQAVASTFDYNQSVLMSSGDYDSDNAYGGKGVLQTYLASQDYEVDVTNPAPTAIAGYTPLQSNASAVISSIENRGAQGVGFGGLSRAVNPTYVGSDYVFPIGTNNGGYNAIAMNFTELPAGTKKLRGLFVDGNVGSVNYHHYGNLTCSNQPQWFIFDEFTGQGYWSFDAEDNGNNYKYSLKAYPSNYNTGADFNNRRMLKYSSAIGDIPNDNLWTDQVVQPEYLLSPTKLDTVLSNHTTFNNASACFNDPTSQGVPGGPYIGFSHFQMGGNGSSALPVELVSLKAFPVDNEFIRVAWTTATEINNKQFDVLRSEDGLQFFKIGEVAGNGTTTEIKDYTFDDKNVLPNTTYYYRLNQVDFDGEEELSNIVSAAITGSANVVISEFVPNPTRETSRLFITSPTDIKLDVTMFNAIGQEIQSSTIELPAGVQTPFVVDGHVLAAGNYFVSLKNESLFMTRKLVITAH